MKHGILTRILSLVLTLALLLPMMAMFPAAAEETLYDNSDLGPDYAESKEYLACEEYIPGELDLDIGMTGEELAGIEPSSVFKYLGKFAGKELGSFLMDKGLDKIWELAFGNETDKKLNEILKQLQAINQKLNQIIDKIDNKEAQEYINKRLKERINLTTAVEVTVAKLKDIDTKFNNKKINKQQRFQERKDVLLEWEKKNINGGQSLDSIIASMRYMMQMRVRDRNYFGLLDDFVYRRTPFEHLGYEFRERERAAELTCCAYTVAMCSMALQMHETSGDSTPQQSEVQKLLLKTAEEYGQFLDKNKVTRNNDYCIFQMKGMQKLALKKKYIGCFEPDKFQFGKTSRYNLDKFMYHDMRTSLIKGWVFENIMDFFPGQTGEKILQRQMDMPFNDYLIVSGEWEVYNARNNVLEECYRGFHLRTRETREQIYTAGTVNVKRRTGGKAADNPYTVSWKEDPGERHVSFELVTMKKGEFLPTSEVGLPEGMAEPEPETRHLTGTVMRIDPDDGTAYVLGDLVDDDGTETVAYEFDMSGASPEYALVNGLNVDVDFIRNPVNEEGQAQFVASQCDLPAPVAVTGTVSLAGDGLLNLMDEAGAEHAFVLPATLTLPETPAEGEQVTVTYVSVTPVKDWLAEDYEGADGDGGIIPDENAPTEYVLNVTLGGDVSSATLDGTVSAMAGDYLTVLDDQGAEHAFQLTELTKLDEGVEEGAQVRVTYHAVKEEIALAEGVPVADGIALLVSPVEPEEEQQELDGIISYADEDTLQVLADDGTEYTFDIANAAVEGEPAEGSGVHVVYRASALGLEAEQVTCFAPDDEPEATLAPEPDEANEEA